MASEELLARLNDLTFFGKALSGDWADDVQMVDVSLDTEQMSQVKIRFADPGYTRLSAGAFSPGLPVYYRTTPMEATALATGGEVSAETVTVTARSKPIRALKRLRGERVLANVSPSQYVAEECKTAGVDYVVQDTTVRLSIVRDVPDNYNLDTIAGRNEAMEHYGYGRDNVNDERPSAWTTMQRLAKEEGFVVYESGGAIHFGKPSWLLSKYQIEAVKATWNTGDTTTDVVGVPVCTKSLDSTDGPDITFKVRSDRASEFLPGRVCHFSGVPAFQGYYLIRSLNYALTDLNSEATVNIGLPDDPSPQSAENIYGGVNQLPSSAVMAVQENLTTLLGIALPVIPIVPTGAPQSRNPYGTGVYVGADGIRHATPTASSSIGSAYLAASLVKLRKEIDSKWPERDRGLDGWLTESRTDGDGVPDAKGCVHGMTITAKGVDVLLLTRTLVGDERINYIKHGGWLTTRASGWRKTRLPATEEQYSTMVYIAVNADAKSESRATDWGITMSGTTQDDSRISRAIGDGASFGGGVLRERKPSAEDFASVAAAQVGVPYREGVEVDRTVDNPTGFDASELVEWSVARVGTSFTDGVRNQRQAILRAGQDIPVASALKVRGALLFVGDKHVAISMGNGFVIEAIASQYAVTRGDSVLRQAEWTSAGLIPVLNYPTVKVTKDGTPIL